MRQKPTTLIWEQQIQNIKATVMIKPLTAVIPCEVTYLTTKITSVQILCMPGGSGNIRRTQQGFSTVQTHKRNP
jgi:hypothetical protein